MTEHGDPHLERLYRRASAEEPGPELDRRVLEAARRSTRRPLAAFVPFGGHWPLGLAAAAVMVASATLVVYLVDTGGPYVEEDAVGSGLEAVPGGHFEALPEAGVPAPADRRQAPVPPSGGARQREAADTPTAAPEPAAKSRALELDAAPPARLMRSPAVEADEEAAAPEASLARITALLEAGRRPEARRLLAEFVARYPEYPLPERLSALLATAP